MRLIDADVLINKAWDVLMDKAWDTKNGFVWEKIVSIKDVADAPIVDAVPVVRCKDCKYYVPVPSFTGESQMGCEFFKVYDMDDDDYCSRGWKK